MLALEREPFYSQSRKKVRESVMEARGEDSRRRRSFFSSKSCSTRTMGTIADVAEGLAKNSVDAGARRIEINFSLQHFSMSCTDDGCGIEPQEMKGVASCRADGRADGGFLVAVADCCHMDIVSLCHRLNIGWRKVVHGGTVKSLAPLTLDARRRTAGTTVAIQNIFFPFPIRRSNILHAQQAHARQIRSKISALAIALPDIAMEVFDEGACRYLLSTSGSGDFSTAFNEVGRWGNSSEAMLKSAHFNLRLQLHSDLAKGSCDMQFVLVNRHSVRYSVAAKIIGSFLPTAARLTRDTSPATASPAFAVHIHCARDEVVTMDTMASSGAQNNVSFVHSSELKDLLRQAAESVVGPRDNPDIVVPTLRRAKKRKRSTTQAAPVPQYSATLIGQQGEKIVLTKSCLQNVHLVGQAMQKFVMFAIPNGFLVAMDQHAASERIHLEEIEKTFSSSEAIEQHILESPISMVVNADDIHRIRDNIVTIEDWKFKLDLSGGHHSHHWGAHQLSMAAGESMGMTVRLLEVPKILGVTLGAADFRAFLRELGTLSGPPSFLHRIFCSVACKKAVKFGDSLERSEQEEMMKRIATCRLPFQCAHGRPTMSIICKSK